MNFNNTNFLEAYSPLIQELEDSTFSNLNIARAIQAEFCVNEVGQLLYINEAMCCLSNYSKEELLRMTLFEIDTRVLPQNWTEAWQKLKSNDSITYLTQYSTKANHTIDVQVSIRYVKQNGIEFGCAFVSHANSHQYSHHFENEHQIHLERCLLD